VWYRAQFQIRLNLHSFSHYNVKDWWTSFDSLRFFTYEHYMHSDDSVLPALKAKQYPIGVETGVNQDELQMTPDHMHCNTDTTPAQGPPPTAAPRNTAPATVLNRSACIFFILHTKCLNFRNMCKIGSNISYHVSKSVQIPGQSPRPPFSGALSLTHHGQGREKLSKLCHPSGPANITVGVVTRAVVPKRGPDAEFVVRTGVYVP